MERVDLTPVKRYTGKDLILSDEQRYTSNHDDVQLALVFGLGISVFVQSLGLLVHSWQVVSLNLETCDTCSSIVMATGRLMDKHMRDDSFIVEDQISWHVGLWSTSVCTSTRSYCMYLSNDEAMDVFTSKPLPEILKCVINARTVVVVSFLLNLVTLVMMILRQEPNVRAQRDILTRPHCVSAILSGICSLTAILSCYQCYAVSQCCVTKYTFGTPWSPSITVTGHVLYYMIYLYDFCHYSKSSNNSKYSYTHKQYYRII